MEITHPGNATWMVMANLKSLIRTMIIPKMMAPGTVVKMPMPMDYSLPAGKKVTISMMRMTG